jgi:hypothetical protein
MLENTGIVSMLTTYPSKPELLAWITMLSGTLKWAFFVMTVGLVLVGLVRAALNRFRKQADVSRMGAV